MAHLHAVDRNEREALHLQGLRRCYTCSEVLSLDVFGPQKYGTYGISGTCRPCNATKNRQRYKERGDKGRRRTAAKYGLTLEQYEDIMSQDCKICGEESEHLDHCHATGDVRGALCRPCNKGLGHFKDSPAILRAAAHYLEMHHGSS